MKKTFEKGENVLIKNHTKAKLVGVNAVIEDFNSEKEEYKVSVNNGKHFYYAKAENLESVEPEKEELDSVIVREEMKVSELDVNKLTDYESKETPEIKKEVPKTQRKRKIFED